jgi:hypothetical protein
VLPVFFNSIGLDSPGIESRWGAIFSAAVQTGCEAHPVSYTMGTGSFPGVKRPGRGVEYFPPSNAEVKERVELYLYSPSGSSWPVLGRTYLYLYLYLSTSLLFKAQLLLKLTFTVRCLVILILPTECVCTEN